MNKDLMDISAIETFVDSLLGKQISANTFIGTLPESIDSTWKDMVLIDCNKITDLDAMGKGTVLIWLYAKPMAYGRKNLKTLSKMGKDLNVIIENAKHPNYSISRRYTYPDYDSNLKWHCNIIELIIKIY